MAGRPSKLTEEIIVAICEAVASGAFPSVAARAAGVSPHTLSRWCRRGRRDPESPEGVFFRRFQESETRCEIDAVKKIIAAGAQDVKHLEWWLERRASARWANASKELRRMTKEFAELRARLEKAGAQ